MKISVSSYSFDQYIRDGRLSQLSCVAKAAEMGFDGIEFTDIMPQKGASYDERVAFAKEIRKEADRVGLPIVAYTVGANLFHTSDGENDAEVKRLCRELDIAKILGAPVFRHDACWSLVHGGKKYSFDTMLPVIAENARRITEYAEKLGIRTCSENHGMIAQDSDRMERLYNAVGHENYGLLVDIGNFACVDENSVTAVSRVAPYAFHVHAKDFTRQMFGEYDKPYGIVTRGCNLILGCVIGEGVIPTAQCIAILKKAGYDGYVTIEYEGVEDCMSGIARGLENLKAMI